MQVLKEKKKKRYRVRGSACHLKTYIPSILQSSKRYLKDPCAPVKACTIQLRDLCSIRNQNSNHTFTQFNIKINICPLWPSNRMRPEF